MSSIHARLQNDTPDTLPAVYLYPGQMFISAKPAMVTTILGSCVAVCLWDPAVAAAGIIHYLLPSNKVRSNADLRYGNTAIDRLIEEMVQRGAWKERMQAKTFGGATMLLAGRTSGTSIGDRNIAAAREHLSQHGIAIVADQTGGYLGRKLLFHTGNGCAYVKEIAR
jgi:chemotaxis protein CheD